jgi:hypothetical protein
MGGGARVGASGALPTPRIHATAPSALSSASSASAPAAASSAVPAATCPAPLHVAELAELHSAAPVVAMAGSVKAGV